MELKVIAAREAMAKFEGWKCAKTWDSMVAAVAAASDVTRKVAEAKCEAKYGHMFCGRLK